MGWGENGEGEVSLQSTWDQGGQGSLHTERREFQVSKGNPGQGGYQGELAGGIGKGD
jgi:hypothetical protein